MIFNLDISQLVCSRLLAAWEVADVLPRAVAVPADPQDRDRMALATGHGRRVDATTVAALADVLAATRHLKAPIGSAAVLSGIRANRALAHSLLADARQPIRDRVGLLAGELHQYLGWLLAETGCIEQARVERGAALALGVEFDCAARRDERVFIAQHAYNTHQEARRWAITGQPAEVDRALGRATERVLAQARQTDRVPRDQIDAVRPCTATCPHPDAGYLAHPCGRA